MATPSDPNDCAFLCCEECRRPTPCSQDAKTVICPRCTAILADKAGPQPVSEARQRAINRYRHRRRVRAAREEC